MTSKSFISRLLSGASSRDDDSTIEEDNARNDEAQAEEMYGRYVAAIRTRTTAQELDEFTNKVRHCPYFTSADRTNLYEMIGTRAREIKYSADHKAAEEAAKLTPMDKAFNMLDKGVEVMTARREVLEAQIARDTEELFEINVSVEAYDLARRHITDVSLGGKSADEPAEPFVNLDELRASLDADITEAKEASEAAFEPIPANIGYSPEHDNFYSMISHGGQGEAFHRKWVARRDEFPVHATVRAE